LDLPFSVWGEKEEDKEVSEPSDQVHFN
jgi:hypothetical protein